MIVSPDQAKQNLANYIRTNNRMRDLTQIDTMIQIGYESLNRCINRDPPYNLVTLYLSPNTLEKTHSNDRSKGINFIDDFKYKSKSKFLKDFYQEKGHDVN